MLSHPKYEPSIRKTIVTIKKYTTPKIHKYLWFFNDIKSPKNYIYINYMITNLKFSFTVLPFESAIFKIIFIYYLISITLTPTLIVNNIN